MNATTATLGGKYFGMTKTRARRRQAMSKATRDHRLLIRMLCWPNAPQCAYCEEDGSNMPLTIDHPNGRERANHSSYTRGKRWDVRVREYWREYLTPWIVLKVACHECNSADNRHKREREVDLPDAPF